jgi:hypothetical protein
MTTEAPITDQELHDVIGVSKIGHRQRILTRLELDVT